MSTLSHKTIADKINAIEAEMKRAGFWQSSPLDPAQLDFHQAFAMDTMAYVQWLQFIFIPRVRQIVGSKGAFPASSMVGTQAIREFDTQPEASQLVTLLCEFDGNFR